MKKNIIYLLLLLVTVSFSACSEDELSGTSVIKDSNQTENAFDRWITDNLIKDYNIDLKYRMEDILSDRNYNLVPADFKKSTQLAQLIKFLCLDVYDEVTGSTEFIRSYFPKMIHFVGSPAYRNNGTMILGTAEGGLMITLYNVNDIDVTNVGDLNYYYFKTIHHEFAHILHQTKPYSTDFNEISGGDYVKDSWNTTYRSEDESLPYGFISPYSSSAVDEDFVELISIYVTNTAEEWENKLNKAGDNGRIIIESKFEIVYNYMLNSWNIDLSKLRDTVLKHESEVDDFNFDNF